MFRVDLGACNMQPPNQTGVSYAHTVFCGVIQLSAACIAHLSPYSAKTHLQLSLTLLFALSLPLHHSHLPASLDLFSLLCSCGHRFLCFPSYFSLQTALSHSSHRSAPPCSSSQTACRRPMNSWNRTVPFGSPGKSYCTLLSQFAASTAPGN